jgi:nucleoid DNA-binding protein
VLGTITLGSFERRNRRATLERRPVGFSDTGRVAEGKHLVTKKEIVKTISDEIGLTQLRTKEIVQKTFDAIVETLVEDHRIELRNFGVFEVKRRAARKARNPRTGDKVYVPEKFVVTFKPGKEMEQRVREMERRAAEQAMRERANGAGDEDQTEPTDESRSPPTG